MTKRFISFIAALLLCVNMATAQSLTLLGVGSAGGNIPNQIIFQTSGICTASSNTCTLSSAAFGAPQGNRYIIVSYANVTCSSGVTMTIGGVSATVLRTFSASTIFGANVPSGSTGNIVATCTGTVAAYMGVWTIYGLNSLTPDSTCQLAGAGTCALSTTVNNGYAIGMSNITSSTGSCVFTGTGIIQDFNFTGSYTGGSIGSSAGAHAPTTGVSLNVVETGGGCAVSVAAAIH